MIFEYFAGRVVPVIDEGDPPPSETDLHEAQRLEAAIRAQDPRIRLVPSNDWQHVRVFWISEE
jgi:hypothetical protein